MNKLVKKLLTIVLVFIYSNKQITLSDTNNELSNSNKKIDELNNQITNLNNYIKENSK